MRNLNKLICLIVAHGMLLMLLSQNACAQVLADTSRLALQLKNHKADDITKANLYKKLSGVYFDLIDKGLGAISVDQKDNYLLGGFRYQLLFSRLSVKLKWEKGIEQNTANLFEQTQTEIDRVEANKLFKIVPLVSDMENLAKTLPEGDLKYKVYTATGFDYVIVGNRAKALDFFEPALAYFRAKNNAAEIIRLFKVIGFAYTRSREDRSKVKPLYDEAIAYAKTVNDQKSTAFFYVALGHFYQYNDPESSKLFQQAIDVEDKTADYGDFSYLILLSNSYWLQRKYQQSLQVLNKGIALILKANKRQNDDILQFFYRSAFFVYKEMGEYALAEKFINSAITASKNPKDRYVNYDLFSDYYIIRAKYLSAVEIQDKMLDIAVKTKDETRIFNVYKKTGDIYARLNNFGKALFNYKKALTVTKYARQKETINKGMGMLYLKQQPAKALGYFKGSLVLYNENKREFYPGVNADIQSQIGQAYLNMGNYSGALASAQLAVKDSGRMEESDLAAAYRTIANVYRVAPDTLLINNDIIPADKYKLALALLNKSREVIANEGYVAEERDELDEARQIYDKQKDYANAYATYRQYIVLRDSILNQREAATLSDREATLLFNKKADSLKAKQQLTQSEVEKQKLALQLNGQKLNLANKDKALQQASLQKQAAQLTTNKTLLKAANAETSLQRTQSRYFIGGIAALILLSFFIGTNYRNQRNANKIISVEKQRSDNLLLNILPADVAEELKEKGKSKAKLFDQVTVLFTDFVNFTTISELLTPEELVDELDHCFKAFDGIMATHHIEKIKTIGDAYLAVAGLPHADENHALNTVNAAKEIQQFIKNRKAQLGDKTFDVRIGIHSGSVVAGIVGVKKFAYDIWGDTVNTAARMEQNSQPGKINVSEKTYELVKDRFEFTYRGEIEAKNKGALKMYFVG